MIWDESVTKELGREELLDNEIIRGRDLAKLSSKITQKWKEGSDLLQDALKAKKITDLPSPDAWLDLISGLQAPVAPFIGRPLVNVYRRRGAREFVKRVKLGNVKGSFAPVNPDLRALEFLAPSGGLTLDVQWGFPVFLRRNERLTSLGKGPRKLMLQPGDVVTSNQWELEILDS
jgi:hypothetical protein